MFVTKAWLATMAVGAAIGLAACNAPEASASPLEDEPGFSCVDDGNRVCGPGNGQAPAGCYDDGGVLVAVWPCTPWQPSDGYRHGDGSWTEVQDGHAYLCVHSVGRTLCTDDPDEPVYLTGYTN